MNWPQRRERHVKNRLIGWVIVGTAAMSANACYGFTLTTLHAFCNACTNDGQTPNQLIIDPNGALYGTTSVGGEHGKGSVFEVVPNGASWTYKMIYSFCAQKSCRDGSGPTSLILDTSGNLYGTTARGGEASNDGLGVAFKLVPNAGHTHWRIHMLYEFGNKGICDPGCFPNALTYSGAQTGLLYDGVSPLFGTTIDGGGHASGGGTLYRLTPGRTWREKTLYLFCSDWDGTNCLDGNGPDGLSVDTAGNIFGVTVGGGLRKDKYAGTAYELSPAGRKWNHAILHYFCGQKHCADGANPIGVVLNGAGNLIGTASGGANDGGKTAGVVYRLVPNGTASQYAVLYNFCSKPDCADGNNPEAAVALDGAGNIFGTTIYGGGNDIDQQRLGGGVVFKFGSTEQVLYSFCSKAKCADGEYPSQLVIGSQGNVFGITTAGGADAGGTVFELSP